MPSRKIVLTTFLLLIATLSLLVTGAARARAQAPTDLPPITVSTLLDPAPGYIFLSNFAFDPGLGNVPHLLVLDNSGHPVRYEEMTGPMNFDFKLQPDGTLTYSDGLGFARIDQDFGFIDSLRAGNGHATDMHELRILPDGHALLLARHRRHVDMTDHGGHANAVVIDLLIQEVDTDGVVYWEWNTADHFEITDTTPDIPLTAALIDYAHCNAVDVDTDGNILLSSRHLDEITKVDRATGDIIWRWGGKECKNNEFTFVNDTVTAGADTLFFGFSHQHAVRRLENGNILLFDNGNLREPQCSRAVEYELDEAGRIATKVWEYRNTPDVTSTEMGYAQRLANGNTLIGWGGNEDAVTVTEVKPDGTKVFEMSLPADVFSYRAYRFLVYMAAITRHVGEPGHHDFNDPDNVTGVAMDVHAVTVAGSLTVQRHDHAAHDAQFAAGTAPVELAPCRWVMNGPSLVQLDATFEFDLDAIPPIESPESAVVYARPAEGQGEFSPLPTLYDNNTQTLQVAVAELAQLAELVIGTGSATGVPPDEILYDAPRMVQLGPVYPNPFSSATSISYEVGSASRVTLKIYSARGAMVAMLVDEEQAAGSYEAGLDAARLASGVYFCRLEVGAERRSVKIIAVK